VAFWRSSPTSAKATTHFPADLEITIQDSAQLRKEIAEALFSAHLGSDLSM
jgi:hypothetical protein